MINHLRTLLLNKASADSPPPTYPGEEFVPANYAPKTLVDGVATVHKMLFGLAPDRALLNLRLRELLGLLHTSELAEYVTALDPRITYWPPRNDSIFTLLSAPAAITNVVGTKHLFLLGQVPPYVAGEQINFGYNIAIVDGSHVSIQPTTAPVAPTVATYSVTAGLSSVIPLPGSTLSFQFESGPGSVWTVSWLAYPEKTLMGVYQDLAANLTADIAEELFGGNPPEPMRTFENLWMENPYPTYRMCGVTLALGYQINNLVV